MADGDGQSEILTNVPTSDALRQAEITAVRILGDSIHRLALKVDKVDDEVRLVGTAMAALQAQDLKNELRQSMQTLGERLTRDSERVHNRIDALGEKTATDVSALAARINSLEGDRDQRTGAKSFVTFVGQMWPLILAIIGVVVFVILQKIPSAH